MDKQKQEQTLFNESQAAHYLGMSRQYLRKSRCFPNLHPGPVYIRIGRTIRYDLRDLDDFIRARRVESK